MPWARTFAYGNTRPTASLRFETGLVTTVAPRSATSSSSGSSIQTPCARTRRGESRPMRVQVRARALAGAIDTTGDLVLGLEEVDVHGHVARGRLLGDPRERGLARGVDAVRRERRLHPRGVLGELVEVPRRLVARCLAARRGPCRRAAAARRWRGARVAHGARDRGRSPVHVPEPHRAGADHLETREPGAPVDVVVGEARLGGPDLLLEPLHEREIAAEAAEQGHRRVGVPVHEPGEEHVAVRVEHVVARLRARRRDRAR